MENRARSCVLVYVPAFPTPTKLSGKRCGSSQSFTVCQRYQPNG
jgi:hypothetical protein